MILLAVFADNGSELPVCVWSAPSHRPCTQLLLRVPWASPSLFFLGVEWEKGLLLEMELPAKLLTDQFAHCLEQS